MKNLICSVAFLTSLSLAATAAPEATHPSSAIQLSLTAPINMTDYVGKYKMEGLPFDFITVDVKDGKLMIVAGDQGGELLPLAEADKFDAAGQATLQFIRDANKKVTGVTLDAQGMKFEGKKTGSASAVNMTDYVGKYKMEGLPFDYIIIAEKEGKLTVDTGSQNGELTPQPEADKFDAAGQAMLKFTRDASQKITGVTLEAQGNQFTGKKES